MDMGEKIYHLRTQKGLTLEELGNMVGVGKSTVRKWENGMIANMKRDKILKVSEALGTSPAYLMGWNDPSSQKSCKECTKDLQYSLFAGSPVPENVVSVHADAIQIKADFCLKAAGDSMNNARIFDGDIVFIHQQDWVENGEIAAVVLNGESKAVLKRLYYYKEKKLLILKSENAAFEDCVFMEKELKNVRILGKAIALQSCLS